ncbi:autotransporter outer membrane beta-barrel domain-containing protein [Camelimonas abortus]|uniref:Autotransporter outer membrane beta-barrel domain-containing protein n=1 Tax=Camelimonas abortus TaxID=1017184 RepID=A0ABV7LI65_9HYPH
MLIRSAGAQGSVINAGVIAAASDRAIADMAVWSAAASAGVDIRNAGLVTGFVNLAGSGVSQFVNAASGVFDIRHFADTDGDGVRDAKRVAISTLGDGAASRFDNQGLVRLAAVTGAAVTDATGYYAPTTGADSRTLDSGFYNLNREGVVQGQLTGLAEFSHSGVIDLRGPAIGNTLVMTSNASVADGPGTGMFVANGGQLYLNVVLNDGVPPGGAGNSYADVLVVDGARLGSAPTAIMVGYDPSAMGAPTPGNGIEVVEVRNKALSGEGVFVLGARVAGGAYEYTLRHNGVGPDAADGNWYLRASITPPVPPAPPAPPTPEPEPAPGPGPAPAPAPTPPAIELPHYRAETPVYMTPPALAGRLGLAMLGAYHDRRGEDGPDGPAMAAAAPAEPQVETFWCKNPEKNFRCTRYVAPLTPPLEAIGGDRGMAAWARVYGATGSAGSSGGGLYGQFRRFRQHGPSYDFDMGLVQAGLDVYRRTSQDGSRNVAGFYVGVGRIGSTVSAVYGGRAGRANLDGYSVGAYWTHRGAGGWYVDAVIQGTNYQSRAHSWLGEGISTSGWGFAASLEAGAPLQLGHGWLIEPQAQLVYQHISLNGDFDRFGRVDYGGSDAAYGRLGLRLARNWTTEAGGRFLTWARVNVWHDFGAQASTRFSNLYGLNPVTLKTDLGGSWAQLQLGLSAKVADGLTAFASGDYNVSLAEQGHAWGGRVGLRLVW